MKNKFVVHKKVPRLINKKEGEYFKFLEVYFEYGPIFGNPFAIKRGNLK